MVTSGGGGMLRMWVKGIKEHLYPFYKILIFCNNSRIIVKLKIKT